MNKTRLAIILLVASIAVFLTSLGAGAMAYFSPSVFQGTIASAQPQTNNARSNSNATLKTTATSTPSPNALPKANKHYEYVFPDGGMWVYDIDHGHRLVKQIALPTVGVRGVAASPSTGMVYISYGGNGGTHGNGIVLAYNLKTDKIAWTKKYPFGVDSQGISPDGKTIYMPDGSQSYDGNVYILNAADGAVTGKMNTVPGASTHNTFVNLQGTHVYTGAVNNNNLFEFDATSHQLIKKIGPLKAGVRPYSINRAETLAFTNASSFLGFEVSDITTGKLLYHVPIKGFTAPATATAPSHGISLSPNEKEVYVIDSPNSYVHVFDVTGLPASPPVQVADIAVPSMAGVEVPCPYDCQREGWLEHSRDGRYVYVGDAGVAIDTATRKIAAHLPALTNGRKFIEIDWSDDTPVFANNRLAAGYAGLPLP
jgi:DNA-binding beta-propeller fold protein YncE